MADDAESPITANSDGAGLPSHSDPSISSSRSSAATLTDLPAAHAGRHAIKHDPTIQEGAAMPTSKSDGPGAIASDAGALLAVTEETQGGPNRPNISPDVEGSQPLSKAVSMNSRPFSVFTVKRKWMIVIVSSVGAVWSPISSNIYVPSLPVLVTEFHRSAQDINLTLTVYLVFQALSPSFFGGLSDSWGRRPVVMLTLAIYVAACIGIALTPTSAYWLLMVLRCVQAIGGSPLIAIGSGIIGDIATTQERGKYIGVFSGINMAGPSFGPVLGGILVQTLSWRWIFWILAIGSGASLAVITIFQPETLRSIVGDGSIPPPLTNRRPAEILSVRKAKRDADPEAQVVLVERPPKKKFDPFGSFKLMADPNVACVLLFASMAFAALYAVLTTFSTLLADNYGYDDIKIGLCYLANGGGAMLTAVFGGRILDWDYKRQREKRGFKPKHPRDIAGFPIERTRLHFIPHAFTIYVLAILGYGWSMQTRTNIAAALVCSFAIGFGNQYCMQVCTVLLVDLYPTKAGAVTASFNLTRCGLGAIAVSVVDPVMSSVGTGWAFTIMAAFCVACVPAPVAMVIWGPGWREKRMGRLEAQEEKEKEKERVEGEKQSVGGERGT